MGSFAAGSAPTSGSLGKILTAYTNVTGYNLKEKLVQKECTVDFLDDSCLPPGMTIGRVMPPVSSNHIPGVFSSLWIVQLPSNYDHNGLAALYTALKNHIQAIINTSEDGVLVMPLIGVLPSAGVTANDVIEEVISLLNHVASTNKANSAERNLRKIQLYMQRANVEEMTNKLKRSVETALSPSNAPKTSSLPFSELDPTHLPDHLDKLGKTFDQAEQLLQQLNPGQTPLSLIAPANSSTESSDTTIISSGLSSFGSISDGIPSDSLSPMTQALILDKLLFESVGLIVTTHSLSQSRTNNFYTTVTEEKEKMVRQVVNFVICLQARRILERYCRLATGDMRINAGFKEVDSLSQNGKMSSSTAEQARKVIRNGNKAAHTDNEGASLTDTDGLVTLMAICDIVMNLLPTLKTRAASPPAPASSVNSAPRVFMSGDWTCPSCQTHNFASRSTCFSCSSPKEVSTNFTPNKLFNFTNPTNSQNTPGPTATNAATTLVDTTTPSVSIQPVVPNSFAPPASSAGKPGDWICSACNTNNFASRTACFKCSSPKQSPSPSAAAIPSPTPVPVASIPVPQPTLLPNQKPGDWVCSCGTNNFASRAVCFRCNSPKLTAPATAPHSPASFSSPSPTSASLPGDWMCACGTNNFASRAACFKCNSPKTPSPHLPQPHLPQTTPDQKTGDWVCNSCKTNNFASRNQCFKCSLPKFQSLARPVASPNQKPGDWVCACGTNNFASRAQCFRCNAPKS